MSDKYTIELHGEWLKTFVDLAREKDGDCPDMDGVARLVVATGLRVAKHCLRAKGGQGRKKDPYLRLVRPQAVQS